MSTKRSKARRLGHAVEPIAANVYFAPEAQQAYAELGLGYPQGYFSSRGGCLGQVDGYVIAAAFGVFYPAMVKGFVDEARSRTDVSAVLAARERGAVASLERILGPLPDGIERATELLRRCAEAESGAAPHAGRPLFSGLRSLGWPGTPLGDLWRAADLVREHRGDAHTCAWVSHGLTAIEVLLLTEAWWGLSLNSYMKTRGWPEDDVLTTLASLRDRKLLEGDELTDDGMDLRMSIEDATDRAEASVLEALGDDADGLFAILEPWGKAVVDSGGYPTDPSTLAPKGRP